ncbi:unnamed protein product [Sphagnum jensenii]|uniref:Uncharacterized protein n=1 Tax=Sphagnum jensenii TaxID=128206 RepID=A0ABP0VG99_9BRYO
MGMHTDAGVSEHKHSQADRYLKPITADSKPEMKKYFQTLADNTRAQSNQLFVQGVVLNEVVDQVFRHATTYYVQRLPSTLGAFKWRIDAKDILVTEYEKLWQQTVLPAMQFKSLNEPLLQIRGENYTAFSKFQKEQDEPPDYLKGHVKDADRPFKYIEVNQILTDNLKYQNSKCSSGLQLVDFLAAIATRACNGTLQNKGWSELGRIMVQNVKGKNALRFLTLQDIETASSPLPYRQVVLQSDRIAKRMFTKKK